MAWQRTEQDKRRHRTQLAKVIEHLQSGAPLTQDTARALFGVRRLASRVSEAKKLGHVVLTLRGRSGCAVYLMLAEGTTNGGEQE